MPYCAVVAQGIRPPCQNTIQNPKSFQPIQPHMLHAVCTVSPRVPSSCPQLKMSHKRHLHMEISPNSDDLYTTLLVLQGTILFTPRILQPCVQLQAPPVVFKDKKWLCFRVWNEYPQCNETLCRSTIEWGARYSLNQGRPSSTVWSGVA